MPVFFIQDAMKFPDLVHAVKPEPHHGMPQAASAHDTFWDFVSLMPESTHMLMWVMSTGRFPQPAHDAGVRRAHVPLRQRRGRVALRQVPLEPRRRHALARLGRGRQDFRGGPGLPPPRPVEAIEAGAFPEWELGVQVFTEEEADVFSFDVLDPTKIVPEELVPVRPVGRMVLNRNPDNFFAETEQVAFCAAHIVPGLDFSNDRCSPAGSTPTSIRRSRA